MPYVRGYEEDGFLKQLGITRQTLEILSEDKVNRLITIQDSNFKVNSVQEACAKWFEFEILQIT